VLDEIRHVGLCIVGESSDWSLFFSLCLSPLLWQGPWSVMSVNEISIGGALVHRVKWGRGRFFVLLGSFP
jgi:hypothetical protein